MSDGNSDADDAERERARACGTPPLPPDAVLSKPHTGTVLLALTLAHVQHAQLEVAYLDATAPSLGFYERFFGEIHAQPARPGHTSTRTPLAFVRASRARRRATAAPRAHGCE